MRPVKIKILVDAEVFFEELEILLQSARKTIDLKMMTFEGDNVGLKVASMLSKKSLEGVKVNIFIDYYTSFMLSDKFMPLFYIFSKQIRDERKKTKKMMDDMQSSGVVLKRTFFDHQKYVKIDNRRFIIGGFNISEHNFSWHDLSVSLNKNYGNISKQKILSLISSAKDTIYVESPYIAGKFIKELFKISKQGVKVKVIIPKKNNLFLFALLHKYYIWRFSNENMSFHYFNGMTHLKAMIIDSNVIVGSFNFNGFGLKENSIVVDNKGFANDIRDVLIGDISC